MKYTVNVVENNYGHIEVRAKSPEEAIEKAQDMYDEGNVIWCNTDTDYNIDEQTYKQVNKKSNLTK